MAVTVSLLCKAVGDSTPVMTRIILQSSVECLGKRNVVSSYLMCRLCNSNTLYSHIECDVSSLTDSQDIDSWMQYPAPECGVTGMH